MILFIIKVVLYDLLDSTAMSICDYYNKNTSEERKYSFMYLVVHMVQTVNEMAAMSHRWFVPHLRKLSFM